MIRAAQESEVNTVKAGLVDAGREMFRGIRAKLDEGVQLEGSLLTERQSTADAAASNAAIATVGAGSLLFLIVVFSIAVISRSLIRPLLLLQNVLQDIREGQLQVDVPYRQREDEMGALGRSIEELRLSAVAKHQFELQASDERKKREAERETLQMAAEDAANARVRNAVEGFATALGRLAEGDVAFQIDTPFAPEFDSLRQDLNHTITQLGEALGAVGGAVVSIQSGASEINSGTSDLARRTEQQAASLEETA
jgi:methyl-accepting chemotaxis protein